MTIECTIVCCGDKKLVVENDITDENKEKVQIKIGDIFDGKFEEKDWCFVDGNELIKAIQNAMNW